MTRSGPMESTIAELIDCLEQEHRALLAEDVVTLESVVALKERLLSSLASLQAGDRRATAALTSLLTRARALNERNAATLTPRMAFNRVRLNALHGARNGDAAVYTARGAFSAR